MGIVIAGRTRNGGASKAVVAPAVQIVDMLFEAARKLGASDLHLDPKLDHVVVRVRVDGVLRHLEPLPCEHGARIVGRIKALAGLLAYRTDTPQEGRIAPRAGEDGRRLHGEVRVATYPTADGERVALRFASHGRGPGDLDSLELPSGCREGLRCALAEPEGVVLLTGPSGSGKTTTLYACLAELTGDHVASPRSVVTIEDPIENRIPCVTQTEIDPAAGLDFQGALRALLRQDPDVLLVGEIRDRQTARVALEAGLTGHLVLSTVHAGTAALVFARLLDMGVEPFVLTTAVRGVLAQRLLRRVCSTCGASDTERCSDCDGTGYRGRCVAAEWLPMHPNGSRDLDAAGREVGHDAYTALRRAVLARADGEVLVRAAAHITSLRSSAENLVRSNTTTASEVERVLGHSNDGTLSI